MKLCWRPAAEADRLAIYDHIEADDPQAAERVDERILVRILTLLQLPHSGRPGRVEGTRELTVGRTSYFVIYQIEDDTVRILRILHSAREWSEDLIDEHWPLSADPTNPRLHRTRHPPDT